MVTREQTQKDLNRYIKKLGNSVVTIDDSKRFWLFYVSVSVGGWTGSSINVKWSDDGIQWTPAKRLITSPFLNLSTLVKGNPIIYSNGHLLVLAYHEFIMRQIFPHRSCQFQEGKNSACKASAIFTKIVGWLKH